MTDVIALGKATKALKTLRSIYEVLPASDGSEDAAAINTIIQQVSDAGGGTVRGRNGETYLQSVPIVGRSNVTHDFTGCTVAFADDTIRCNQFQNAAVTPVTTATDAATTVGSSVVTSTTLAAVAQVGQAVGVVGAGPPGGDGGGPIWMYGQVQSVNTGAHTVTLTGNLNGVAASIAVTGATAYLFDRDSNIGIVGGTWDALDNWADQNDRKAAGPGGADSSQIRLRRVDGLVVRDIKLKVQPWLGGLGWTFGVAPGDCTDFLIENVEGDYASTCVQGEGPLARGVIRNCFGKTQDDQVALGCVGQQGNDLEGDITDVLVDGITARGSWRAFAGFAGSGGNGVARVLSASVRSVKGYTVNEPVRLVDYAGAGAGPINVTVEDVIATPGAGKSWLQNTGTRSRPVVGPSRSANPVDSGMLAWSYDSADASGTLQPSAGVIYVVAVKVPAPIYAANVVMYVKTAGATLTSGQCLVGLYDFDGPVRAKTATQHVAWTSVGPKSMALIPSGSYTLDVPAGRYFIAILANGTTTPIFAAKTANVPMHLGLGSGIYTASPPSSRHRAAFATTTSRTSLPSSLTGDTLSDNNLFSMPWAGIT